MRDLLAGPREDLLAHELGQEEVLVEVQVEEVDDGPDLATVRAAIWCETESQKGILIGAGGRMVRDIGTAARKEIEREIGKRAHLDLSVRVRRSWRADDALLDRLGIT